MKNVIETFKKVAEGKHLTAAPFISVNKGIVSVEAKLSDGSVATHYFKKDTLDDLTFLLDTYKEHFMKSAKDFSILCSSTVDFCKKEGFNKNELHNALKIS